MSATKRKRAAERREAGEVASAPVAKDAQTVGLDEILRDDDSDAKQTKNAVDAAMRNAKQGMEIDPRLMQLFKDFKLYRILVVVIIVIGFGMMLVAMYLYSNGYIDGDTQNNILLMANIVIVAGMVIAFGRARPIREDINAWHRINAMALEQSHGKHGATKADIDRIFLSRARNKHVPPTPEFRRIRRVWMGLIAAATVITISALIAQRSMSDVTVPVLMIMVSLGILVIATVLDRVKMKPLRKEWERDLDQKIKAAEKASRKARAK